MSGTFDARCPRMKRVAASIVASLALIGRLPAAVSAEKSPSSSEESKKTSADAAATADFPYPLAVEGPKPAPVTPPTPEELQTSIARGVDYLLGSQRKNGAWGGPQRTKELNIYAPVPGAHLAFRTGVTALALEALVSAHDLFPQEKQQEIDKSIDRGQTWLLENSQHLRRRAGGHLQRVGSRLRASGPGALA